MSDELTNNTENHFDLSGFFFSNTFKEIIRTMTGLELKEEKMTLEDLKAFKAQISGVIILCGEKSIMISLSMSNISASTLVSFMVGLQSSELSNEDLNDGVSEIANVVGGKIKAKLNLPGTRLTSLLPFTIKGNDHYITQRDKVLLFVKKFRNNDVEILAKVFAL
jgi:chemotaxis protein CheX